MRTKKLICLLLCCMMLCGCGNTEKNIDSAQSTTNVDEEKLKSEGYTDLAGIAYGKMSNDSEIQKISLIYLSDNAELSTYLYLKMIDELSNKDVFPAFSVTWEEKEYNIDAEEMNTKDFNSFISLYPEKWKDVMKKLNDEGLTIDYLVDKGSADLIDGAVEEFVSNHVKVDKIEMDLNTSGDTNEGNGNIILSKDYEIDGEKATITFSEREGKYKISIIAKAVNEEKVSIILLQSMTIFDNLKNENAVYGYDIGVSCGDLIVSYLVNGERQAVFGTNKNGDSVDKLPDWVVSEFTMSDEEAENFIQEIEECMQKFETDIEELNK